MEKHEKNIQLYLENGGDPKLAARHKIPNLENRAKMAYLVSQLDIRDSQTALPTKQTALPIKRADNQQPSTNNQAPTTDNQQPTPSNPKGLGLIAQYPVELHSAYKDAYSSWISVCGLKIELNAVPPAEEEKALSIQERMIKLMEVFDRCKNALDHYNEHKRVLPTESKTDFTKLSPIELLKEKTNLASLISRRKSTIKKMEEELPEPTDPTYRKKLDAINRKIETLEDYELDLENIKKLLV